MKNNYKFLFILGLLFLFLISPIISQEDFISFMDDETTTELQWSGSGSLNTRYYTDYHNPLESNVGVFPKLKLNLDYKSHISEFHSRINLSGDPNILIQDDMSYYLKKMLDEVYFQMFFYNINFEAGYIKLIWGKGNNFFTFDNLNALDYTDFLNPSYLDRKIAEAMIKLNIPFGMQGLVQAVYTPAFTPDQYPGDITTTSTLDNGQLGLRITNSIFGYDLGISYQYTFLRESDQKIPNSLERIHLFGLETAFVIAAFNIRAESAYYMTSDFSGKNPLVHNNKLQYLFGFDRDLMIHNISINIQGMGEFKLGTEGITGISDIDYESNDAYSSHLLTAGLKESFLNEKITTELNGTYSMEDGDFMVIPELRLNLIEDTWLNMKYTFFYGDSDTFFGQFEDNDFLEIRMEYSF